MPFYIQQWKNKHTFIEEISNPLSNHKDNHNRKTIGEVAGGLYEDDGEWYCHPDHASKHSSSTKQGILAMLSSKVFYKKWNIKIIFV